MLFLFYFLFLGLGMLSSLLITPCLPHFKHSLINAMYRKSWMIKYSTVGIGILYFILVAHWMNSCFDYMKYKQATINHSFNLASGFGGGFQATRERMIEAERDALLTMAVGFLLTAVWSLIDYMHMYSTTEIKLQAILKQASSNHVASQQFLTQNEQLKRKNEKLVMEQQQVQHSDESVAVDSEEPNHSILRQRTKPSHSEEES